MTANDSVNDIPETSAPEQPAPRPYVSAKEAQGHPQPDKTDEQMRADMRESVRRNAAALQTLAKL
ncbi:hypothetical protein [Deinococcus sp.]|uniref:hypothetical protein n=1 Tax=Deinococcus sp. TaxID=47478 RepID=UPI003CC5C9F5